MNFDLCIKNGPLSQLIHAKRHSAPWGEYFTLHQHVISVIFNLTNLVYRRAMVILPRLWTLFIISRKLFYSALHNRWKTRSDLFGVRMYLFSVCYLLFRYRCNLSSFVSASSEYGVRRMLAVNFLFGWIIAISFHSFLNKKWCVLMVIY